MSHPWRHSKNHPWILLLQEFECCGVPQKFVRILPNHGDILVSHGRQKFPFRRRPHGDFRPPNHDETRGTPPLLQDLEQGKLDPWSSVALRPKSFSRHHECGVIEKNAQFVLQELLSELDVSALDGIILCTQN